MNACRKKTSKLTENHIEKYELGNGEIEVNFSEKHSVRLAYINLTFYWLCKILIIILMIVSVNSVSNILKMLGK
jgi:hypothetical protein